MITLTEYQELEDGIKNLFTSLPRNIAARAYDIYCYYSESRTKHYEATRKLGNNNKKRT